MYNEKKLEKIMTSFQDMKCKAIIIFNLYYNSDIYIYFLTHKYS